MARTARFEPRERNRSLAGWLMVALRKLFYLALLLASLGVGAWFYVQSRVDDEIRNHVCQRLAEFYDHSLEVSVGSARRIEGQGIELRQLRLTQLGGGEPLAEIDELLISCSTDLQELLGGQVAARHLELRRPKLFVTRECDGSWNVLKLLRRAAPCQQIPTIAVTDATLEFQDRTRDNPASWQLRGVQVDVTPAPDLATTPAVSDLAAIHTATVRDDANCVRSPPLLRVQGALFGDHFRRGEFDALVDVVHGAWSVKGNLRQFEISAKLAASLPTECVAHCQWLHQARGVAQLEFKIEQPAAKGASSAIASVNTGDAASTTSNASSIVSAVAPPIRFAVTGEIEDGRIDDPRLPHPLTDIHTRFSATQDGVRIEQFAARNGPATIHLTLSSQGLTPGSPLELKAQTRKFELEERLVQLLPKPLRDAWEKFAPRGSVHADIALRFDGERWIPDVVVECLDISFAYHRFPYRLQEGRGVIQFKDGTLACQDFRAMANDRPIRVQFQVRDPGPRFTGAIALASEAPIPIDEKLLVAMENEQERLVRSLRPRGEVTVWGRFERTSPDAEIDRRLEIGLRDCQIQFAPFPYPLDHIRGTLAQTNGQWEFRDLHGHNDSAYIECKGEWRRSPLEGNVLTLNFVGTDVVLDDELKASLRPGLQRLWSSLRPRGTVDQVNAQVRYDVTTQDLRLDVTAEKWRPKQNVEGRSISLQPTWLPYQWNDVVGSIRYRDGDIELRDIRAAHGRTALQMAGTARVESDGRWSVQLPRFIADRLVIDQELMAALPVSFGATAVRMNFNGPVGVQGSVKLAGTGTAHEIPSAQWNLTLDVENGSVNCGLPLQQIRGSVQLAGSADERGFVSAGELDVHSLICRDLQFTHIKGPIRIEPTRVVLGDAWTGQKTEQAPRQMTARAFGGTILADSIIYLGNEVQFDMQALLAEGDVAQIARDVFAKKRDISGRAVASIRLQGSERGVHTFRGSGRVRLHDADIYEVPVMVALFKSVATRREERRSLTSSDVDFRIQGDRMYLDRIDLYGDTITLKGSGEVGLDRQVNINFYTILGRDGFRLPGVTPLLAEASRQLFIVQIHGNLDEPSVEKKAVPALTDALRQMFPEMADRSEARREQGSPQPNGRPGVR